MRRAGRFLPRGTGGRALRAHTPRAARISIVAMRYRYYDTGYRYKRYKRRRVRKKYIVAAAVLLALFLLIAWLQGNVSGILYSLSYAAVRSAADAALNEAVAETLSRNRELYNDLVTVTEDGEGNVLSMAANAANANLLARQAVALTAAKLNEACEGGVQVPVGAFTGVEWLAGAGPAVTFRIIPVSRVNCSFRSDLRQAGINQTLHSIYLELRAAVSVVMPSGTQEIAADTQVLLCERVIAGKVPSVYFGSDLFGGVGT